MAIPVTPVLPPAPEIITRVAPTPLLQRALPLPLVAVIVVPVFRETSRRVNCAYIVRYYCKPTYERLKAEARVFAAQCGSMACGRRGFRQDQPGAKELCIERYENQFLFDASQWYISCIRNCGNGIPEPDFVCGNVNLCMDLCCDEDAENERVCREQCQIQKDACFQTRLSMQIDFQLTRCEICWRRCDDNCRNPATRRNPWPSRIFNNLSCRYWKKMWQLRGIRRKP
jgi:hypothetical protein